MRVVLDTNVVVSALLFRGPTSRLVALWQAEKFQPLLSKEMMEEYIRVLAYPKFRLSPEEGKGLLQRQFLVYSKPIIVRSIIPVIQEDPSDDIFLACALAGKAEFIVSGDKHLLSLGNYLKSGIVSVDTFFGRLLRCSSSAGL